MARFVVLLSLFAVIVTSALAQTATTSASASTSDPQAITLATKSVLAMTGGTPVSDATLTASITRIAGSDNETGSATLYAKGTSESRVDLNLSDGTQSEARTSSQGVPSGQWKKDTGAVTSSAQHNCWTDAAWFFPALSSLTQFANPQFIFSYIGQEQHNGLSTVHIRVTQLLPGDTSKLNLSRLSTEDFYLDPTSFLPLAVAFNAHPDNDMMRNIPEEIRFANYQSVNGVQVPLHVQELLNGSLLMDVIVNNANINTSLNDTQFLLQ